MCVEPPRRQVCALSRPAGLPPRSALSRPSGAAVWSAFSRRGLNRAKRQAAGGRGGTLQWGRIEEERGGEEGGGGGQESAGGDVTLKLRHTSR